MSHDASLEDYIPKYLENRLQDCSKLTLALGQKNFEEIRRIGHTIKGVAKPFGFPELETHGIKLEEAAIIHDEKACRSLVQHYEQVVLELKSKFGAPIS